MKRILFILVSAVFLYGAPPAATSSKQTPFDIGRKHFEQGNYQRALDNFAAAINTSADPGIKNKAYYYQGLILYELGNYFSSYISFRNVLLAADDRNKEVYEKSIKNAVLVADKMNLVDKIGSVLEKLPTQLIPNSMVATSRYAIGISNYFSGNLDKATEQLKSVNPESPYFSKANFYLGSIATKKKNYKEALYYFNKTYSITRGRSSIFNPRSQKDKIFRYGDLAIILYSNFFKNSLT
jgi:tetratricopeptide (TPR) repeat protein